MKKLRVLLAVLAGAAVLFCNTVYAYNLDLACRSAVLIEETSGKVLYEKNADTRMYPASMTKILTALVALKYINPDEYVVTGSEIREVPWDSSKAYHIEGETLLFENLIRGLIIPSGNETACVVARAVAKRVNNVDDISYAEAEALFCGLLNAEAKALGAVDTNFVNPHGYHNDNHYTTAHDMALISRTAMENELIRRIAGEMAFEGNGAGEDADPLWSTQEYRWPTHNELIVRDSEYFYSFANGIKTGFTNEAGYCVAASAEKNDRKLIAIVMGAEQEYQREVDAKTLFEFGFNNFGDEVIQSAGEVLYEAELSNVRLGESESLELVAEDDVVQYMSKEEFERIEKEITILEQLLAPPEKDDDAVRLLAPIEQSQPVAEIRYTLDGELIYAGKLLAAAAVEERTFNSDVDYYLGKIADSAFSIKAVPFWLGGVLGIFIVLRVSAMIIRRRQRRRNPYRFAKRRRR